MDEPASLRKLRVVHVVFSLDCGGLEHVVLDLVRGGQLRQQQVSVICLERPGELAHDAQSLGAMVHCADKPAGVDCRLRGRLLSIFSQLRPDVVHTHQIGALFYAGAAARRFGVPMIAHTEHGIHYRNRLRTRLLAKCAGRYAHRFFCVSAEIAADVRRFGITAHDRIHVIRNGVDTGRFARTSRAEGLRRSLGFPENAVVIGTVGRLAEIKRQDVLIRGFSRLLQRMPDARLLLVGDGPRRQELIKLTEQLGLCEHVHFAGYQTQTERYLQAMDIFALTSRSEGMPLAILEAWSVGLPVIASRVAGLSELIDDGQTGMFFSAGDDKDLAAKLETLLRSDDLAQQLGAAGQTLVRSEYGTMNMVDTYQRHYQHQLGAPSDNHAHPYNN